MKRIIQTKKDAAVDDGKGNPKNGMIVSGKVKFDELGRQKQTIEGVRITTSRRTKKGKEQMLLPLFLFNRRDRFNRSCLR